MSTVPLPADAPPLLAPRTRLVGREQERTAARARLIDEAVPLLTLLGTGGVGKTRLALAIANELAGAFDAGAVFVDLSPIRDPAQVVLAISQAVGVRAQGDRPLADQLHDALRRMQLLLVLDNCEQIIGAAPAIASLLDACPAVQVLATSRAPWRIRGEHLLPVDPLALPAAGCASDLREMEQTDAVALFLQRARASIPGFVLTAANAATVAAICRRLDGLPLAIELAAARLRLLSPEALLALLSQRLRVLTTGERDLPGRQRTLQDTIAWSTDLLSPPAARLFARLSVFAGGFDLAAAVTVVEMLGDRGNPPVGSQSPGAVTIAVLDGLAELSEQSLLLRETTMDGTDRFRMLETVHDFAVERLALSSEREAVRDAHAAWMLALVDDVAPHLWGTDPTVWLDRLDGEHANLLSALGHLEERNRTVDAIRLAGGAGRYWEVRGHWTDGRARLERVLASAEGLPDLPPGVHARAMSAAGTLAWAQGDYQRSLACHRASLELYEQAADERGAAFARNNIAAQLADLGETGEAVRLYADALAAYRRIGDAWGTTMVLVNLGFVEVMRNKLVEAEAALTEGLALARAIGDTEQFVTSLFKLGDIARQRGELDRAAMWSEEALAAVRPLGNPVRTALVLWGHGKIAQARGDHQQAIALVGETLDLCRQVGDRLCYAQCIETMAPSLVALGQAEAAAHLVGAARAHRTRLGTPLPPGERQPVERAREAYQEVLGAERAVLLEERGSHSVDERIAQDALALVAQLAENPEPIAVLGQALAPVAGPKLSRREREVLELLAQRWTDPEIAERLFLSPRTVQSHVQGIFNKLGVSNRREAAAQAARLGLV